MFAVGFPLNAKGLKLPTPGEPTMTDESLARMRSHRNNIRRYRELLKTRLTELEREYIERRLSEEQSALQALTSTALPFSLTRPRNPSSSVST
jgi:hypothetical protein